MSKCQNDPFRGWAAALLLILATGAVFGRVGGFEFVKWDDSVNVYENPHLRPSAPVVPWTVWLKPYEDLYIPVTYTVWAVEACFSGHPLDARVFHITNLILHILSALVVYRILRLTVNGAWPAAIGALLFSVHPVQVEPVAWVTGMKDILSGLFSLVAVWQYLAAQSGESRKKIHFAAATAAFVLALLSKPTSVMVPLVAGILDWYVFRRSVKEIAASLGGWAVLTVVWIAVTLWAQPDFTRMPAMPVWVRPIVAGDAITFYLRKLAMPVDLGPDYGRSPAWAMGQALVYATALIPCVLAILLWRWRKQAAWLAVAGGVWLVGILPVLGFIPFGYQVYSTVADRYLYFSMLGPALAMAGFLANYRSRILTGVCVAVVGLLGVHSFYHSEVWRNNEALFTHALKINPNSFMAHNNLGLVLAERGKLGEALEQYEASLRIKSDNVEAIVNIGTALNAMGKRDEAMAHFSRALKIQPDAVDAHINLGTALVAAGDFDRAYEHFFEALRIRPGHPEEANVLCNLGIITAKRGDPSAAMRHYDEALRLQPDHIAARYNLAIALAAGDRLDESIAQYTEVLRRQPDHLGTHVNLGVVLARQGKLDDAAAHFSEALRIQPGHPDAAHNLRKVKGLQSDNVTE